MRSAKPTIEPSTGMAPHTYRQLASMPHEDDFQRNSKASTALRAAKPGGISGAYTGDDAQGKGFRELNRLEYEDDFQRNQVSATALRPMSQGGVEPSTGSSSQHIFRSEDHD